MLQKNIRQGGFAFQLPEGKVHADGLEPYPLCCFADTQQAHPLAADVAPLPQALQGIMPAIVLRHHAQTGRTTVYRIVLGKEGKRGHRYLLFSFLHIFLVLHQGFESL